MIEIFDGEDVVHVDEDDVRMSSWLGEWDSNDSDESSTDDSATSEEPDFMQGLDYDCLGEATGSASGVLYINPSSLTIRCTKSADRFRCGRKLSGTYVKVRQANGVRCGHCFP